MAAYGLYGPARAKQINNERRQTHTYYNERPLGPRGSLLPCEPKCQCSRSAADCISLKCLQPQILQDWPWGTHAPQFIWVPGSRWQNSLHPWMGGPLIGWGPTMCALYGSALNGGEASDWLRPRPWQQEGDNLPEGAYQSGNGYSTRVSLPGYFACNPLSWREASHVSSQGKEAVSVTHDI